MTKKIPNINARDFATILNINPYQTPFQLLESKIENKYPFFGNKFTEHGNKYEKVAIKTYEIETGNEVDSKQKNTKHKQYDWITGRYDGVTCIKKKKTKKRKRQEYENENEQPICIIEIKCPLKKDRIEPLTIDNIPKYYWSQCQVYMNMLDCDTAHYVEYYIEPNADEQSGKLYYIEIKKDNQWWEESLPKIEKFREEIKKYFEKGSLDEHPVRIAEKEWEINCFFKFSI